MKSLPRSLLLALALTTCAWMPVQAQTFEQSLAAYQIKDYGTAFTGFKKLAEQGDAMAQFNLGVRYDDGRGVPKDDQLAYFWYLLASAQGDQDAVKNRDIVEKKLMPQQRANAQAAARVWKPK